MKQILIKIDLDVSLIAKEMSHLAWKVEHCTACIILIKFPKSRGRELNVTSSGRRSSFETVHRP